MENEKNIYQLFRISILLKGAISLAEVIVGVIVLFIPVHLILTIATDLTENLDPDTFLVTHTLSAVNDLSALSGVFVAIYLLSRGGIKLLLILALLKNKLWAYPWSLVVLGLFVIYQIYEIVKIHSLAIIAITLFDLVVMYYIWKEYTIVKKVWATRNQEVKASHLERGA